MKPFSVAKDKICSGNEREDKQKKLKEFCSKMRL